MRNFFLSIAILVALAAGAIGINVGGSEISGARRLSIPIASALSAEETPAVNIPPSLRQSNWIVNQRGSCVHATMVALFRWQGREHMAAHWRQTYSGGETAGGLRDKLDREGVRYADTRERRDAEFLEWAVRTRRGCLMGIRVQTKTGDGYHAVALVHLDAATAGLLDNNDISRIYYVPRDALISNWCSMESWAATPVYSPAPPLPLQPR